MSSYSTFKLVVDEQAFSAYEKEIRLDQFLAAKLSQFSRSRIQKLINEGMVLVDDVQQKSNYRLKLNANIVVRVPPAQELFLEPEAIALDIVFEDKYLAVINKAAGMVTHPGAGIHSGTLVHALMHHMRGSLSGISGVLRPGIVHRLDKDTSGLLVIAKDDVSHRKLASQIEQKTAKRIYLAVLEGSLDQATGEIIAPIGRHPSQRTKMAIVEHGRKAQSQFMVLERAPKYVLAQIKLLTGRTHQIRVHMASLGCPVVGDIVYNHKSTGSLSARKRLGLVGHALHAQTLSFMHPHTAKMLEFAVAPPDDLSQLLTRFFPKP